MNRDVIPKGPTRVKWSESLALFGGMGAFIFPPIFYYNAYKSILEKPEYLQCRLIQIAEKEAAGEDYSDNVRNAVTLNGVFMAAYLLCHFYLFSRPESSHTFKNLGIAFSVIQVLGLIFSVVALIWIGNSICNDTKVATAAYISSFAIIAVNMATMVGAIIFYCVKTANKEPKVAVVQEERSSLVNDNR